MADTFTIPMNPPLYASVKAQLIASTDVITHSESSGLAGRFATKQVAFSYAYDPNQAKAPGITGLLSLTILAKSGLARFASTDTIKTKLLQMLAAQGA